MQSAFVFSLLVIIAALIAVAATQAQQQQQQLTSCSSCNYNGTCPSQSTPSLCSCYSGSYGANCESYAATTAGCSFYPVEKLQTNYPFTLNEFSISGNMVTLSVVSPLVADRLDSTLFFNGSSGASTEANADSCTYPFSATNWNKNVVACQDKFTALMNWSQMRQCGSWSLDTTTDPTMSIYTNTLVAQSSEVTGYLRNEKVTRSLQYNYPLKVSFQNSVLTSSSIRSFAPIVLQASVSNQRVEVQSNSGIIELTTSVQWPFKYSTPQLTSFPTGFTIASVQEVFPTGVDKCSAVDGEPCLQVWRISFQLNSKCQLNGNWDWMFNQICNPAYTLTCPVPSAGQTDTLSTTLTSENYCSVAQIDIGLSATLTSYADSARQESKNAFLRNQIVYFRVDTTSTSASLLTTTVDEIVTINQATNSTIFLYQNGAAQEAGSNAAVAVTNTVSPTRAQFQFKVDQNSAPVAVDQFQDYTIRAKIIVTYGSNQRRTMYVQYNQLAKTNSAQATARALITASSKVATSSASSIAAAGSSIVTMLVLALVFALLHMM